MGASSLVREVSQLKNMGTSSLVREVSQQKNMGTSSLVRKLVNRKTWVRVAWYGKQWKHCYFNNFMLYNTVNRYTGRECSKI